MVSNELNAALAAYIEALNARDDHSCDVCMAAAAMWMERINAVPFSVDDDDLFAASVVAAKDGLEFCPEGVRLSVAVDDARQVALTAGADTQQIWDALCGYTPREREEHLEATMKHIAEHPAPLRPVYERPLPSSLTFTPGVRNAKP